MATAADDMVMAAFEMFDGETKEEALVRLRRDFPSLASRWDGPIYITEGSDLPNVGLPFYRIGKRRKLPVVGYWRPSHWPRHWK